jgi:hypothetical protein
MKEKLKAVVILSLAICVVLPFTSFCNAPNDQVGLTPRYESVGRIATNTPAEAQIGSLSVDFTAGGRVTYTFFDSLTADALVFREPSPHYRYSIVAQERQLARPYSDDNGWNDPV